MRREKNRKAFSWLEISITVFLIVTLAILSLVVFINIQDRILDSKRIEDIKTIQTALDKYANENGGIFPSSEEVIPGKVFKAKDGSVLLEKVPMNPNPRGGKNCPEGDYKYDLNPSGKTYTLKYCLNRGYKELSGGTCLAFPGMLCVQNDICSCSVQAKHCCGYCKIGNTCGGGILATKNYHVIENNIDNVYDLIAMPSGCDLSKTNNPKCSGSDDLKKTRKYKWSESLLNENANSAFDGLANTNVLAQIIKNEAAKYCADLNIGQFSSWYLPAQDELMNIRSVYGFAGGYYWASTQYEEDINKSQAVAVDFSKPYFKYEFKTKTDENYIRCIHR